MPENIRESRTLSVREAKSGKAGRLQIGIITPGWGSSGYYPAEVLEAAGTNRVFPAGTQMFLDHPGEAETYDRPERSLRDLAAVLTEDATWDGERLAGEAQVFGPFVDLLTDETFAKTIGVSIRASATMESGEAEGRNGRIITQLVEAQSIDFVTKAGRGGQILQVLESARPAVVVERAIEHGVAEATANDTREALNQALSEEYGGEESWTYVRDFDDTTVWFEHGTPDGYACYAQAYNLNEDGTATLSGDRTEVRARTEYVPVASTSEATTNVPADAGQPNPEESQEGAMSDTEAAAGAATEATTTDPAGTPPAATAAEAADTSREGTMTNTPGAGGSAPQNPRQVMEAQVRDLTNQVAQMQARESARDIVAEVLASGWIGEAQRARLTTQLMADLPLVENQLDVNALRTRATEALENAETEAAEILTAAGAGTPRGLGSLTTPASEAATAQTSAKLVESFKALGLSESAADIAVKGR